MKEKDLTIAILAFNRNGPLIELVRSLIESEHFRFFHIVVCDDASDERVDTILRREFFGVGEDVFRVVRNESNLGYALNFRRAFFEAETSYLMVMSHDDLVVTQNVEFCVEAMRKSGAVIGSPRFERNNKIYRGRRTLSEIEPKDVFWASSHAPGLIYDVQSCRNIFEKMGEQFADSRNPLRFYPQVVLMIIAILSGRRCVWIPATSAVENEPGPTGHNVNATEIYSDVAPRWHQWVGFIDLIDKSVKDGGGDPAVGEEMKVAFSSIAFQWIIYGVNKRLPRYARYFVLAAARYWLKSLIKRQLRRFGRSGSW